MSKYDYDVAIIGGGPAGLNSALYCSRNGLSVLLLEKMFAGGKVGTTYEVDNYLGTESTISGTELAMRMGSHAKRFGGEFKTETVTELKLEGKIKTIITTKNKYTAKAVILALGAAPRTLGLSSEEQLKGKGISYCATCDGGFYRGKTVAVVGGGDTALEDALFLKNVVEKIYLIHKRDSFRGAKILADQVFGEPKIQLILNSVVKDIFEENGFVSGIECENKNDGTTHRLDVSGVFVGVGTTPSTQLVRSQVETDEAGYIKAGEDTKTSLEGVFAAGDARIKPLRQIITAAADGAVAAYEAALYIQTLQEETAE